MSDFLAESTCTAPHHMAASSLSVWGHLRTEEIKLIPLVLLCPLISTVLIQHRHLMSLLWNVIWKMANFLFLKQQFLWLNDIIQGSADSTVPVTLVPPVQPDLRIYAHLLTVALCVYGTYIGFTKKKCYSTQGMNKTSWNCLKSTWITWRLSILIFCCWESSSQQLWALHSSMAHWRQSWTVIGCFTCQ